MFGGRRSEGSPTSAQVRWLLEFHRTVHFLVGQTQEARRVYHALDAAEITSLLQTVLSDADARKRSLSTVLSCLACFQPGSLRPFHERLLQQQVFYPGVTFCGAFPETSHQLLRTIDHGRQQPLTLYHLVAALAWVGDENAQRAFAQWRERPPSWVKSLHIAPHEYAAEAGWELTPEGTRRDLFCRIAMPLIKNEGVLPSEGPVHIGEPLSELCRWCGRPLTVLLDLDLTSETLGFLAMAGSRLRIGTCDLCTGYGTIFTHCDSDGAVRWHEANLRPKYLPGNSDSEDAFPRDVLRLGSGTRGCLESARWMLPGAICSQVGGLPTWIQDAKFPTCPSCGKKMPFVGQIDMEDCVELGEGLLYAFACATCRTAATTYQQS